MFWKFYFYLQVLALFVFVLLPDMNTGSELPEYLNNIPDVLSILALYCVAYSKKLFTHKIWIQCSIGVVIYSIVYLMFYINPYLDRINFNGTYVYYYLALTSLVYVPGYVAMVMMCMKNNNDTVVA
ncbi:MAG: hypothetical protein OCD76_19290 [Reichenbachiella sp.]